MPENRPIIIIEDDADDQEILREILHDLNIPNFTRFFESCVQALDYLLTTIERPFLIISDINVPGMNGMEFRDELNKNQYLRKKNIPFVFLTTNPDMQVVRMAYQSSVQGYFVKPTSLGELKEMLRTIIGYWRFSRQPVL